MLAYVVTIVATHKGGHMNCKECGKEFEPKTYWQKFCSAICKWKNWDKKHPRQNLKALKEATKAIK
jgi:hypothetical protein